MNGLTKDVFRLAHSFKNLSLNTIFPAVLNNCARHIPLDSSSTFIISFITSDCFTNIPLDE